MAGNHVGRGPGHGPTGEKAKDFKGTWGKLIQYCQKYWGVMILALVASAAGTVLMLLGPDKLSELTKLITDGFAAATGRQNPHRWSRGREYHRCWWRDNTTWAAG